MKRRVFLLATSGLSACTYVHIAAPVTDSEVTVSTEVKQDKAKTDTPIRDAVKKAKEKGPKQ